MTNILTDPLPDTVSIEGYRMPVNTDFRVWIGFELACMDISIRPEELVHNALTQLYVDLPKNRTLDISDKQLFAGLIAFYRCGQPEKSKTTASGGHTARAYDFKQDAPMIVAAFQQAYGIDLTTTRMHWWKFRALFDALPADCRICKIMEYRTADTSDMPERTKAFYEQMQNRYRLEPLSYANKQITVEEHNANFISRLRRE